MTLDIILRCLGASLLILFLALAAFLAFRLLAPRRTPAIRGANAIAELISIPINGVQQWLLLRGVDRTSPLLLFIHGGPGTGMIGVMRRYQRELEKHFIVVQWDQRGAGLSGMAPVDAATMNKEQFIADGVEITRYLLNRFQRRQLFLVGHSWGSALGYILARRFPQYYAAFAGLGQISRDTEELAYNATFAVARQAGNQDAIRELTELGSPPYTKIPQVKGTLHQVEPGHEALAGMLVRFKWSEALGGDAKYINITRLIAGELLLSSEYTFQDALAWLKNKGRSITLMYEECNRDIDLYQEGTEFAMPVFFLLGRYDLLTVPSGAEALFETLRAPEKKIYWFDAGHEIHWERPAETQQTLIEVFGGIDAPGAI
jgi:pimeloyl-ACP methyl ester carboxylesterase